MGTPASTSSARRGLSVLAVIALLAQVIVPLAAFPAGALAQEEAATPSAPVDSTAPVVSVPADITVTADAATGTAVVTFDVSASDDVDGPVAATCDPASGAAFLTGTTTVTCTATDSAGNTGSGSFAVTVNPAQEPEPTQAPEPAATEAPAPEPTATEAPAPTATTRPVTGPPAITSDKEDYAPGERVTLTGTNWQPGEEVRIVVNDDQGQTWKRDVTVIADENGNITDAFNLPDWFVATYTVKSTGPISGTATTSFTDGTISNAIIEIRESSCTTAQSNFPAGSTVCASVTATITGGGKTNWRIQWYAPGVDPSSGTPTQDVGFEESAGTSRVTRTNSLTVTNPGNWTVVVCKTSNPGSCSTGNQVQTGTFSVAANSQPVANGQNVTTNEDTPISITLSGTDADGNNLTFSIVSSPSHGTLGAIGSPSCSTVSGTWTCTASVTYTPNANYFGSDSFTFKVNDGTAQSNAATVTITVSAVNDTPDAVDDSVTVAEDSSNNTIDVLTNDTDVDGDTLSVTAVGSASHGTAALVSGQVQYTPNPDYFGSDSFTYTISDGNGGTDTATVVITVTAVNDAPVANDQNVTTDEDTSTVITLTASDVDGDSLAYTIVNGVSHGTLSGSAPNLTYMPDANYNGFDSFTFKVHDGSDDSNVATVSIAINPVNDVPVADAGGPYEGDEGSPIQLDGSDSSDVDGDSLTYVWSVSSSTPCLFDDATLVMPKITCDDDGTYTVTLTVSDGKLDDFATAEVTVNNVAPTATFNAPASVNEGGSITLELTDPSDPSSADASAGFHYIFACDGEDLSGAAYQTSSADASVTCTYDDGPSTHTVKGRILDKDDGFSEYVATVTVDNVNPFGDLGNDGPVNEGSPVTVSFANVWDASSADLASLRFAFDCDGDPLTSTTYETSGTSDATTCTFGDNGDYTVTGRILDKDGGIYDATTTVTVQNVDPTIDAVTNDGPVEEGSSVTITVSASDPAGANDPLSYEFDCDNDGTYEVGPQAATTATCLFNDDGAKQVNVRVSDGDGGSAINSTSVTVNNVAPTVDAGVDATINEGSVFAGSGSFTDPGADTWTATVDYGDGSDVEALSLNPDKSFSLSHTYADNGIYTVTIAVTDDDNGNGTDTLTVTVNNVAPAATFNAPASVTEGSSVTISLTDPSDPSSADTAAGFAYAFDCGDGNGYGPFSTSNSASCPTTDNGTRTVKGKIRDKDDGFSEYVATVTVDNVNPFGELGNNGPVAEGSPVTVSFSGQSDPSSADTSAGFRYAFACDGEDLSGATYQTSSADASATCTFADNGSYTVRARIIDKDNGYSEYTTTVTVNNVAPSVTAPASQTASEGTAKTFDLGSFSDPGADSPWAVDVNWGDGSPHTTFNVTAAGSLGTASHTYADNGTYAVTVTVTDKDAASDSKTFQVTVANVAPVITEAAFGSSSVTCGANTVTLTVRFTDPGADTHKILVDWSDTAANDNAEINPATKGGVANTIQHTFNSGGPYWATVTVIELDPEAASAQATSSQISVSYQVSGILPPINPNGSSVFKSGSTIPVKIQVLDCAGVPVATLAPKITIVKISGNDPSSSINEDFYSTSNADTGQVMRYSDGQYIYNLASKSLSDQSATYELKTSIPVNGTVVTVRFGLRTK